jgi:hypothetical protein
MRQSWLLFQWTSTIKIQLTVLVYYKVDVIIMSPNVNRYSWNIAHGVNQQPLSHLLQFIGQSYSIVIDMTQKPSYYIEYVFMTFHQKQIQ